MKVCRDCRLSKSVADFYRHANTRDRLRPDCKKCFGAKIPAQMRRWRAANPERTLATARKSMRAWRARNPERSKEHLGRLSSRAEAWRIANPVEAKERAKRYARKWRAENPERANSRSRAWRKKNPEKTKSAELRFRYGITLDDYNAMAVAQRGACAICAKVSSRRLHVDHDHLTGSVRGLLCRPCNHMLGLSRDNADVLAAAIRYLADSQKGTGL